MSIDWTKSTTGNLRITPTRKPEPGVILEVGTIALRFTTAQTIDIASRLASIAAEQRKPADVTQSSDPAVTALAVEKSYVKP